MQEDAGSDEKLTIELAWRKNANSGDNAALGSLELQAGLYDNCFHNNTENSYIPYLLDQMPLLYSSLLTC